MSYIPLRDRFHFDEATNDRLVALAEEAEADAIRSYHADECGCLDPQCTVGDLYSMQAEEVLAYVLERGLLTLPPPEAVRDPNASVSGLCVSGPDGATCVVDQPDHRRIYHSKEN